MPTNRTPINRGKKSRITPEVIAAYQRARKLHDHPKVDEWEEDGGCHREYLDACSDLDQLLGRQLWEASAIDTIGEEQPPDYMVRYEDAENVVAWEEAAAIRRELERLTRGT